MVLRDMPPRSLRDSWIEYRARSCMDPSWRSRGARPSPYWPFTGVSREQGQLGTRQRLRATIFRSLERILIVEPEPWCTDRGPAYGIDAFPDDSAAYQECEMTDKRNWGSTVLGWFVVQDESHQPGDGTDMGAGAPDTTALDVTFAKDVPMAKGGQVDFDAVFDAAGIDPDMRGHCAKAADLLATLPTQADPAVKKQIVEASLKAFGVPIAKIIEAGVHEVQALEGYIQADARDTRKVIEESQRRIAQHEEEIAQIKTVMAQRGEEVSPALTWPS